MLDRDMEDRTLLWQALTKLPCDINQVDVMIRSMDSIEAGEGRYLITKLQNALDLIALEDEITEILTKDPPDMMRLF